MGAAPPSDRLITHDGGLSTWGNAAGSQGYGETTLMSTHKLIRLLGVLRSRVLATFDALRGGEIHPAYDLGRDSAFIDVGSGYGKVVFHAALVARCSRSVGVECVHSRHRIAAQTAASLPRTDPPPPAAAADAAAERARRGGGRALGGRDGGGLAGGVQRLGVGGAAALGRRDAAPGGELHARLRLRPRVCQAHDARPRPPAPSGALLRPRVVPPAHRVVEIRADEGRRRRADPDAHIGEGDGHVLGLRQHPLPRSLGRPRAAPGARRAVGTRRRRRLYDACGLRRLARGGAAGGGAREARMGREARVGEPEAPRRAPRPRRLVAAGELPRPRGRRLRGLLPRTARRGGGAPPRRRLRPLVAHHREDRRRRRVDAAAAAAAARRRRRRRAAAEPPPQFLDSSDDESPPPPQPRARAAAEAAVLGGWRRRARAAAAGRRRRGGRRRRRRPRRSFRRGGRWRGATARRVVAETFRAGRHAWELVSPAPPKLVPLAPVAREAARRRRRRHAMQESAARAAAPPVAAAAALGFPTAPAALVDPAPKPRHAEAPVRPSTSTEVVLCFTMMEHEGGKFGCSLPFRHAGPHVCEAPSARRRTQKRPLSL